MNLFKQIKENQYINNMKIASKTNLSLLETLNSLQQEYEQTVEAHNKEITTLKIDEMHFNVCITFKDQEYCFKRIFYTDQIRTKKEINSLSEIQIF